MPKRQRLERPRARARIVGAETFHDILRARTRGAARGDARDDEGGEGHEAASDAFDDACVARASRVGVGGVEMTLDATARDAFDRAASTATKRRRVGVVGDDDDDDLKPTMNLATPAPFETRRARVKASTASTGATRSARARAATKRAATTTRSSARDSNLNFNPPPTKPSTTTTRAPVSTDRARGVRLDDLFDAAAAMDRVRDEDQTESRDDARLVAAPNRGVVVENQRRDVSIVDEDATARALTFADIMAPSTSARPSRRALAVYEKTFACGVDGCAKSYGSASSLCAHRRARHPGWRGRAPRDDVDGFLDEDGVEDEDGVGVDTDGTRDAATRLARKRGASGLDETRRGTALGAYVEIAAADAHGRLNVGNRTKSRVVRAMKEACASAVEDGGDAARRAAAAAAARVFASMESAIVGEQERTSAWLHTLDDLSRAWTKTTRRGVDAFAPDARAHAPEEIRACVAHGVARDVRAAVIAAAAHRRHPSN